MDQQTSAVVAHGLLGSVAMVVAAAARLAEDWEASDAAQRALLRKLSEHAAHIEGVLHDLVRGLPRDIDHTASSTLTGSP
jgi:hypothetical protein